jgi:hypothetical protein
MREELSVEYQHGEIVVIRAETGFSATYLKLEGPNLLLSAATVDPSAKPGVTFQFQANAFDAAVRKAREVGWIV